MKNIEQSTQVLREEHRLIERANLAFADIIKELQEGSVLDRHRVWELTQAFKTYVARWHHSNEDFLLSMLRARGGLSADYPGRIFYEENTSASNRFSPISNKQPMHTCRPPHGTPESLADPR